MEICGAYQALQRAIEHSCHSDKKSSAVRREEFQAIAGQLEIEALAPDRQRSACLSFGVAWNKSSRSRLGAVRWIPGSTLLRAPARPPAQAAPHKPPRKTGAAFL